MTARKRVVEAIAGRALRGVDTDHPIGHAELAAGEHHHSLGRPLLRPQTVKDEVSELLRESPYMAHIEIDFVETDLPRHPRMSRFVVEALRGRYVYSTIRDSGMHVNFRVADDSDSQMRMVDAFADDLCRLLDVGLDRPIVYIEDMTPREERTVLRIV